jgi:hypothetical protein
MPRFRAVFSSVICLRFGVFARDTTVLPFRSSSVVRLSVFLARKRFTAKKCVIV